ncbi:hypothetical protein B0H66DRAFT_175102 [Apodospora peruviana]|uniref:Secreted protein n=1 Tax=Apodospora peruviana TaxID=516989 RepID=A0AAE0M6T1_9PEZI|nr:hypothetical protein B0H66DRAFT_175102 [Apodospora peruviana]
MILGFLSLLPWLSCFICPVHSGVASSIPYLGGSDPWTIGFVAARRRCLRFVGEEKHRMHSTPPPSALLGISARLAGITEPRCLSTARVSAMCQPSARSKLVHLHCVSALQRYLYHCSTDTPLVHSAIDRRECPDSLEFWFSSSFPKWNSRSRPFWIATLVFQPGILCYLSIQQEVRIGVCVSLDLDSKQAISKRQVPLVHLTRRQTCRGRTI